MKSHWTILINLAVPGAGLIILRREWLGLTVSLLFGLLAQIGAAGLMLLPAVVPRPVAAGALAGAFLIWAGAQWLLMRRLRSATGDLVEREIRLLCQRADEAASAGGRVEARDLLRAAMKINDEHPLVMRQWAEFAARTGRPREAAKAWRRVLQLERDPDARVQAARAIDELA